jgi:hypothetical protein
MTIDETQAVITDKTTAILATHVLEIHVLQQFIEATKSTI